MEENNNVPEKAGAGAIIGAIIIIVLLVLGAIYFWNKEKEVLPREEGTNSVEDIQSDLEGENIDSLDAEFNQNLEAEL